MIEIIPDPSFDDAARWTIASSQPPAPPRTEITGGNLIVGIIVTPPTLEAGFGVVRPDDYDTSIYSAVQGIKVEYSFAVADVYPSTTAEIKFGQTVLWDKDDGAGIFTGTFTTDGHGGLEIRGIAAGFIIERVSFMADSIRELILQSLTNQLKNMTTANGYDFNVAATSVERARRIFFDDQIPAIGIFDSDETQTNEYGVTRSEMTVRIEMHADAGSTNRSVVMNRMKAALEKALISQDVYHSGLAAGSYISGFELRLPADDDSKKLTVAALVTINFATIAGNPWSQP